jgi:hypothetical protein
MWEGVEFYLITFALLGLVHVANIGIDLNIMLARMERNRIDCYDNTRALSRTPSRISLASSPSYSPCDLSAWLPCYYDRGACSF